MRIMAVILCSMVVIRGSWPIICYRVGSRDAHASENNCPGERWYAPTRHMQPHCSFFEWILGLLPADGAQRLPGVGGRGGQAVAENKEKSLNHKQNYFPT